MAVSIAAILVASSIQRSPFSAVEGLGSPITPLGAMSRVSQAKVAAAFSRTQKFGVFNVGDVVGGVGGGVDQLGVAASRKEVSTSPAWKP